MAACLDMDAPASGLLTVQEYRSAIVSAHRPRGPRWHWSPRTDVARTTVMIFATEGRVALSPDLLDADEPAVGVLIHSTQQADIHWSEDARATVVWLDTDNVVDASVPEAPSPFALAGTPLNHGMLTFASSVARRAEVQTRVSSYLVERLLVEMAYGVLLERVETEPPSLQSGRPSHRARMLLLLNRADPDYGVEDLARDLHMSMRNLQRLFAREGTSPAAALRALRLELAQSLLGDTQYDALSITEIARHSGFSNTAAMRRAFQAHGAKSPAELRSR
nr:helix-turn-helix domain-containing protein [Microbacterium lemovicicum]